MTFTLTLTCDNAAFEENACAEIARILRNAADSVERGNHATRLRDVNGNTVGSFEVTP